MRTALGEPRRRAQRRPGRPGGLLFKLVLTPVLLIVLLAILYLGMTADDTRLKPETWSHEELAEAITGSDRANMHPDELLKQAAEQEAQSAGAAARTDDVAAGKRLPINQQLHELKMDLDQHAQQREEDIRARINAATGGRQ